METGPIDASNNRSTHPSTHYDANYYSWQKDIGKFGGWANSFKFRDSISSSDTVIDFGCGGGFLLNNLNCINKIGIDPNTHARQQVVDFGIMHFYSSFDALNFLGNEVADVIISDNALEHTENPLRELRTLYSLLRKDGVIHFVVPCDSIYKPYDPSDSNHHLFSWSPQNLGNIFTECGFKVKYARPYIHKWPPKYEQLSLLGWNIFDILCRIYGNIERSWFQVELKAIKSA